MTELAEALDASFRREVTHISVMTPQPELTLQGNICPLTPKHVGSGMKRDLLGPCYTPSNLVQCSQQLSFTTHSSCVVTGSD